MFIASLICLFLGIALLIVAAILFFKLGVMDAWRFIRNKRSGKSVAGISNTRARKRHNLGSSKKTKSGKLKSEPLKQKAKVAQQLKSNIDDVVSEDSAVKVGDRKFGSTNYVMDDDSESPTGLLEEESEQPTGLLVEESEEPTGLLVEESEQPTGLLEEESEQPTGLLVEESEEPTGLLVEESEQPTGLLDENKIRKAPKSSETKSQNTDFKFEIVKNLIVVHTDETIT